MWLDKSVRDKKDENDFRDRRGDGMKIRIEIDKNLREEEVVIRSRALDERVQRIHAAVDDAVSSQRKMTFYKGETEYYLPLSEMLFFETDGSKIYAHTAADSYQSKHRLYELYEGIEIDDPEYEAHLLDQPFGIHILCGAVSEYA